MPQMRISNQNHAKLVFASRFIADVLDVGRSSFIIEMTLCRRAAAVAHTQMGRTDLADNGALNYSDATS